MNAEIETVTLRIPGSSFSETLRVKEEIIVPRTDLGVERKSILFMEDGQSRATLYTRLVEQTNKVWSLPTIIGADFEGKPFADVYYLAWKILQERGFPVVPNVWKIAEDLVATTDLCEDGQTCVYDRKIDALEVRDTFPTDREFCRISIKEITGEAEKILNLANRTGVELMPDGAFHLIVKPSGTWKTVFLDIGKVRVYQRPKEMPEGVKSDNRYFITKDIRGFAKAQENILALRQARKLD